MQADLKWLDDPQTFRVNQLPATVIINGILIMPKLISKAAALPRVWMVSGALPLPRIRKTALRNFMHRTMMSANGI